MPYTKSTQREYGDSPLDATRNGGATPYKMKGHTLPGPHQRPSLKRTIDMQDEMMMEDDIIMEDEIGTDLETDVLGVDTPL